MDFIHSVLENFLKLFISCMSRRKHKVKWKTRLDRIFSTMILSKVFYPGKCWKNTVQILRKSWAILCFEKIFFSLISIKECIVKKVRNKILFSLMKFTYVLFTVQSELTFNQGLYTTYRRTYILISIENISNNDR